MNQTLEMFNNGASPGMMYAYIKKMGSSKQLNPSQVKNLNAMVANMQKTEAGNPTFDQHTYDHLQITKDLYRQGKATRPQVSEALFGVQTSWGPTSPTAKAETASVTELFSGADYSTLEKQSDAILIAMQKNGDFGNNATATGDKAGAKAKYVDKNAAWESFAVLEEYKEHMRQYRRTHPNLSSRDYNTEVNSMINAEKKQNALRP